MELPTRHPAHIVRSIWIALAFLGGLLALALLTFSIGVYSAGWNDQLTHHVVRVLPFPAGTVNGKFISIHDTFTQIDALSRYQSVQNKRAPNTIPLQSEKDIRRNIIRKSIRDAALEQILKEQKVPLTDADVHQAFSSQISQVGNGAVTLKAVRDLYNWGPEEYKAYVVRSAVAREKLREHLSFSEKHNAASERQAQSVLTLVQEGKESFADLAKKYSDDVYGAAGGDLGFVRRGQQADEIEEIAFSLEPNKVSELIHTKYGFHIVKVTERREVEGQLEIHLHQIYIAGPSVDEFISEYLKTSRVTIWLPGFRWDKKSADVVSD